MSAYVVDKDTISTLVAAGLKIAGTDPQPDTLSSVGQDLLNECVASVSYRYSDSAFDDLPGSYDVDGSIPGIEPIRVPQYLIPYAYTAPDHDLTRDEVEEAVSSYEYQSCEHPGWEDSWARRFCTGLRAMLSEFPERKPEPEQPDLSPEEFAERYGDLSRDETIKRIRAALKRRSGKTWSVTGGRGTAWGWITIDAPPKRRTGKHVQKPGAAFGEYEHVDTGVPQEFGIMTPADCAELAQLLGKDRVHHQGESIPSGSDYRREYIDRAEGRTPAKYGVRYWD